MHVCDNELFYRVIYKIYRRFNKPTFLTMKQDFNSSLQVHIVFKENFFYFAAIFQFLGSQTPINVAWYKILHVQ